jgi:thiosulfate/3-mercaptopyruvate sulfurtransferase
VIIYDADNALAAARLWWMLTDAGLAGVRVLNGGFAAWTAAGQPVEAGPAAAVAPGNLTVRPGQLPTVDAPTLAARIAAGDPPPMIDVRGAERYAGESEPIDPVAGHIPGAINVPSMINIAADGRFRPAPEIAGHYPDTDALQNGHRPVVYCGSGITAAHTALALTAAGLPMPVVYPGSWSDWITDPDRPVATGDRP